MLDEQILKCKNSINKKQERIKVIESQLKKDSDEVPLAILQANCNSLTEAVNKLQSRADEMKQREVPIVGRIEMHKHMEIDVCFSSSPD